MSLYRGGGGPVLANALGRHWTDSTTRTQWQHYNHIDWPPANTHTQYHTHMYTYKTRRSGNYNSHIKHQHSHTQNKRQKPTMTYIIPVLNL